MGKELNLKEKIFLAWLAPRGIVTAAVASLFSIRLEQAGILGAGRLQGLVFLTILMKSLRVAFFGSLSGPDLMQSWELFSESKTDRSRIERCLKSI